MARSFAVLTRGNDRNILTPARLLAARHRLLLGDAGGAGHREFLRYVTATLHLSDATEAEFPAAAQAISKVPQMLSCLLWKPPP